MFKRHVEDQAVVVGVCVDEPIYQDHFPGMNVMSASTAAQALDFLHVLNVDFVLVGMHMPDMSVWEFLRTMRTNFPHLKWALVGGPINDQQEIAARRLGVTTFFDTVPSSYEVLEIVTHQRRQAAHKKLEGATPRLAPAAGMPSRFSFSTPGTISARAVGQ